MQLPVATPHELNWSVVSKWFLIFLFYMFILAISKFVTRLVVSSNSAGYVSGFVTSCIVQQYITRFVVSSLSLKKSLQHLEHLSTYPTKSK